MTKKKTIYLGEELIALLATRKEDGALRSVSGTLNAVADRYQEVVSRSMPTLAHGEWCLIFDSLNGVWMQDHAGIYIGALTQGIYDSIDLEGLDQKWNVDGKALLSNLHEMSFCQKLAIVDAAERFWSKDCTEGETMEYFVASVVGKNRVT